MDRKFAVAGSISGKEIRELREYAGLSRKEFAGLAGVSVKTVEHWENSDCSITGPVVFLRQILLENCRIIDRLTMPEQQYALRYIYMCP